MKKMERQEHLGVSKNNGTPKSSILIGFSIINHLFWGMYPYFWKHPMAPVSNRLRGRSSRTQGMVCWTSFVKSRSPSCDARGGHMPHPAKYLGGVCLQVVARGSLV